MTGLCEDRKGFSLLEVIIAIAILGFSLLAIIPLLTTSLSVSTETSLASKAQMLGAELISEIQSWPEGIAGSQPTIGNDILNSGCLNMGTNNTCEWDTTQFKGSTITRNYRIDSMVTDPNITRPTNYLITVYVTFDYKGKTIRRVFTAPWRRQ